MASPNNPVTLDEVLQLARELSAVDKLRLIERIAPEIEREVTPAQADQRTSLRGLWRGLDITAADLADARRDMWAQFPRDDI